MGGKGEGFTGMTIKDTRTKTKGGGNRGGKWGRGGGGRVRGKAENCT